MNKVSELKQSVREGLEKFDTDSKYNLQQEDPAHFRAMEVLLNSVIDQTIALCEKEVVPDCPNSSCDQNGTIANQVAEGEWEPEQCQFCYQVRLPLKEKFASLKNI